MAISIVGTASAALPSPNSGITVTLPTGIPNNAKALLVVNWQTTVETISSITTGWTQVGTTQLVGASLSSAVFEATLQSSDSGTAVNVNMSGQVKLTCAVIVTSGALPAIDGFQVLADSSVDTSADLPSYTPVAGSALLVSLTSGQHPTTATTMSAVDSQYTRRVDVVGSATTFAQVSSHISTRQLSGGAGVAVTGDAHTWDVASRDVTWVIGLVGSTVVTPSTVTATAAVPAPALTMRELAVKVAAIASVGVPTISASTPGGQAILVQGWLGNNSGANLVTSRTTGVFTATPTQNNVLLMSVVSSSTVQTPAGWTLAKSSIGDIATYLFYKVAGAAESTSWTVTLDFSGTIAVATAEYSGLNASSPIDSSAADPTAGEAASWLSGTYGSSDSLLATERNRSMDMAQTYNLGTWTNIENPSLPAAPYDQNFRTVLVMYMMPKSDTTITYARVASGEFDAHYQALATYLINNNRTDVIICWNHEFNLNNSDCSIQASGLRSGGVERSAEFRDAWRHVVDVMRAVRVGGVGGNWQFMFNPSNGYAGGSSIDAYKCYPGDDYVDHVWHDSYDRWDGHDGATPAARWTQILTGGAGYGLTHLSQFARAGASRNTNTSTGSSPAQTTSTKELGIGLREWGWWDTLAAQAGKGGGGDNAEYGTNVYNFFKTHQAAGGTVSGEISFISNGADGVKHDITTNGDAVFPYPLARGIYTSLWDGRKKTLSTGFAQAHQAHLSVCVFGAGGDTPTGIGTPSNGFAELKDITTIRSTFAVPNVEMSVGTLSGSTSGSVGTSAIVTGTNITRGASLVVNFNLALGSATASPGMVRAAASVPAPTVIAQTDVTVVATKVTATASVAMPTVSVPDVTKTFPATVVAIADVSSVTTQVIIVSTVKPDLVVAVAAIPTPTAVGGGVGLTTVLATKVSAVAAVDAPVVDTGQSVTVLGVAVDAAAAVPTPVISTGVAVTAVVNTVPATAAVDAPSLPAANSVTIGAIQTVRAISSVANAAIIVSATLYSFVTPSEREQPAAWDHTLFVRVGINRGITVLKKDGVYTQVRYPSAEALEAADIVYLGGRVYPVSQAEATDLTAAGYGSNLEVRENTQ